MFRFDDTYYLYLLLLVPVLVLAWFFYLSKDKRRLKTFGEKRLVSMLMPDVSSYRPVVKYSLCLGALALVIMMLARPQMGTKISHDERKGIEVMMAIDVSNSMLAEDVVPSRLEKSKMMVENMVDNFTNDKIGMVVFAGTSFVQLPITADYVSANMFLHDISTSMIESQGTNIGDALNKALRGFTKQDNIGRAIILVTDGEDHEGGALEAARAAKQAGVRVFVLGIGSTSGSPIPDGNGGYIKDNTGTEVMSALNEQMCRDIAQAGGGAYMHVDNTSLAQQQLARELAIMQKGDISSMVYSEYDEQFQAFALLALVLLITDVLILRKKNPLLSKIRLFKR